MAIIIIATPGAPDANSYETVAESDLYFESRRPLNPAWDDVDSKEGSLVMATRTLNSMFVGRKTLKHDACDCDYYVVGRKWTGAPTTSTQRLPWPRTGMFDSNGNPIPDDVIPQELKDAESELAGQLNVVDRTLDNDVIVQGIKSVRAGSVAVSFKDTIQTQVLPDAVVNLLPPSWFTNETIEQVRLAEFDVL